MTRLADLAPKNHHFVAVPTGFVAGSGNDARVVSGCRRLPCDGLAMKPRSPLLALLSLLPFTATAAAMPRDAELAATLLRRLAGDRSGACIAAAVIDTTVVDATVRRAFVCADGGKPRVDERSAFEIGSIAKTMNATLLAQFMLEGKLSLDTPLAQLLPASTNVPQFEGQPILVRHVVTHRSGLPALPPGFAPHDLSDPYAQLDEAALYAALAKTSLQRVPGAQFEYSNFATMLLSAALARLASADYENLIRERLFAPLAMTHAHIAQRPDGIRAAQGHQSNGRKTPAWTIRTNLAGVGGVRATLEDMVIYVQAQLGLRESPVADAIALTQREVATSGEPAMGMNWMRMPVNGRTVLLHDGGTGGFASFAAFDREHGRGVVVLSDTALPDIGGIGLHLFDAAMPLAPPRRIVAPERALIDALAGDYVLDGGLRVTLRRRGSALAMQAQGQSEFTLGYDDSGEFFATDFDASLRPQREAGGGYRFAWQQLGGVQAARRVDAASRKPGPAPDAKELAAFEGEYPLMPGFALRVFVKDGALYVQGTGQPALPVAAVDKDTFASAEVAAELRFERREGKVVALTLVQNGQQLRGERN
jgi:D-alanyl-D-alanine-carboxypeptidase/D-alanyl-D-alanine-endopeptidase